jgi:integrase
MAIVHLTDRTVRALTAHRPQEDFWDESLKTFGLRVTRHGRKTWMVMYYAPAGKRRMKLGTYPAMGLADARLKANAVLREVELGNDPQADKQAEKQAETFAELAEEYLEKHAKLKKRTWREDQRKLERDVLPHWGRRKAKDISRRDVIQLLDRIVERGAPIQANRIKALVSKVFNFGISRSIVDANPAHLVDRPSLENQRDRVLTESEIRTLWETFDREDPIVAASYKLRLLTAQRGVEILRMKWADIEGGWWTIPAALAKNRLQHRVPLSPQALAIIEELRPLTGGSAWVLESPRKPGSPLRSINYATVRIRRACEVDFVPHDLRRTAASLMTSMGISRLVVAKILNHVERGVTAVYDRYSYDAEKRRALALWGDRLDVILAGGRDTSNMVRIA